MAPSRKPGPICTNSSALWPEEGEWPLDDGGGCRHGFLPGPIGREPKSRPLNQQVIADDAPWSGSIPASVGAPSLVRIPVPGTGGLAIEFTPRGWTPKGGSTSTLFIQDLTGKRHLRLDYGYNVKNGNVEWHWNVGKKGKGSIKSEFGITDHQSAAPIEEAVGRGAKYFKYGGRVFLVVAAAMDIYSIVTASNPLRRSVQVVSGWAVGWGGCSAYGGAGAVIGTAIEPGIGTAIGGALGCIVGGFIGYSLGERISSHLYDWAEDTKFTEIKPEKYPPVESKPLSLPQLQNDPKAFKPYLPEL